MGVMPQCTSQRDAFFRLSRCSSQLCCVEGPSGPFTVYGFRKVGGPALRIGIDSPFSAGQAVPMLLPKPARWTKQAFAFVAVASLAVGGCSVVQRQFLFHPSHLPGNRGLAQWELAGRPIGVSRIAKNPKNIWLLLHGNGGQAADRMYAIPAFSPDDSVFILEYPGYGAREGAPARDSFDQAAIEAYLELRRQFASLPLCVAGESIGSGPASTLASQPVPPDKIVLVVPFDTLKSVAAEHVPYLPVGLVLWNSWDNVAALAGYKGPVEIFGAAADTLIPVHHAEALSRSVPQAQFHRISGGHNDWSRSDQVKFHNP